MIVTPNDLKISQLTFKLPSRTCDTHCHVFGPRDRFPFIEKRAYTPDDVPKDTVAALHDALGVDRGVLVQASIHGSDNRVVVDALRAYPKRYRGVAMIDDGTTERDLQEMADVGVRGIRFNFNKNLGGFPDIDLVKRSVERIKHMGWHLVMQIDGVDVEELTPFVRALPVPFIVDHMARCDAAAGPSQRDFRLFLDWMKMDGAWVKLSCPERMAKEPYTSVAPFARALIEARPDRCLWGTDFPHPNLKQPPDDAGLVNFVPSYARTAEEQQMLLVDNPARLYGFDA